MFEGIEAQSNSLFLWVFIRCFYTFAVAGVFVSASIIITGITHPGFNLMKAFFLYAAGSFFLSSLVVLCSVFTKSPHTAVAVYGFYWLLGLMTKSLLRIPFVPYVYLFLCFADENSLLWVPNKWILIAEGAAMWLVIFFVCRKRVEIRE